MVPIVSLTGPARSGKDTAAKVLCEAYNGVAIAFADPLKRFLASVFNLTADQLWGGGKEVEVNLPQRESLSDFHWKLCRALHGWRSSQELAAIPFRSWANGLPEQTTPRFLMQTFGTECVRAYDPNLWRDFGFYVADRCLQGGVTYSAALGLTPEPQCRYDLVVITDARFRNEILSASQRGGFSMLLERPDAQKGLSAEAKGHRSELEQTSIPPWWFGARVVNDGTLQQFEQNVCYVFEHHTAWSTGNEQWLTQLNAERVTRHFSERMSMSLALVDPVLR